MNAACPRIWEAEAIEDGRLDALGAASFERHAAQCRECAEESKTLRKLHDAFECVEPRRLSPLEVRRQRADLLRRANARIVDRVAPRRVLDAIGIAATVLLTVAVVVLVVRRRHLPVVAQPAAPVFELRAIDGAAFHDETTGPNGRVVLSSGSLAVHVEHLRPEQSFVLVVPEGELAVRGTRFLAEVARGHTERVLVTEGVVAARFAGSPERTLRAGESWTRQSPPPVPANEVASVDANHSERGGPDGNGEPTATSHSAKNSSKTPLSGVLAHDVVAPSSGAHGNAPRESVVTAPADEGVDPEMSGAARRSAAAEVFERAMGAFTAGNYLEADEQFAAFAARFPGDGRREDASFLRAVIATRRGDATAAVARARDYLARFPRGLRRTEMERLVNAPW